MSIYHPLISVIIPTYNEEKYIATCLHSVYDQDYSNNQMEVIVVDGCSNDRTTTIIRELFSDVIILSNPQKIVPISMNMGIRRAKGDYIIRLDAHAHYPSNYISTLISEAQRLNSDNIGAVCRTLPANESSIAKAIAIALSTKFGMGNSDFRVGAKEVKKVDTVPFGCFHRSVFEKVGYYDEELIRNQDDELNGRIIKNGGKIFLIPDLVVDYYGRDTLKKVFKMFYQYGLFKPLGNKKLGRPATLRQFAPLTFVLGLLIFPLICVFFPSLWHLYLGGITFYLLANIVFSFINGGTAKVRFVLALIYPSIHFAYGWGYLVGIFKLTQKKPFCVQSNR